MAGAGAAWALVRALVHSHAGGSVSTPVSTCRLLCSLLSLLVQLGGSTLWLELDAAAGLGWSALVDRAPCGGNAMAPAAARREKVMDAPRLCCIVVMYQLLTSHAMWDEQRPASSDRDGCETISTIRAWQ